MRLQRQVFYDEEGRAQEFLVESTFAVDESNYVAMIPADDQEGYIYILRIERDGEGEEVLVGIEDDELEIVSKAYEELREEMEE